MGMWYVKKGEYRTWCLTRENAEIARRLHPELKGGRISHVLQLCPSKIVTGVLYKGENRV